MQELSGEHLAKSIQPTACGDGLRQRCCVRSFATADQRDGKAHTEETEPFQQVRALDVCEVKRALPAAEAISSEQQSSALRRRERSDASQGGKLGFAQC